MDIGKKVRVSNPTQINYPLMGEVIDEEKYSEDLTISRVVFKNVDCWYADKDLEEIK